MTKKKINRDAPKVIDDKELDEASGGAMLLPAVQKVREAASSSTSTTTKTGTGTVAFNSDDG